MAKLNNLNALRVRQNAAAQHATGKFPSARCWVPVASVVPPTTVGVRNLPQQHPIVEERVKTIPGKPQPQVVLQTRPNRRIKSKKPSRIFQPVEIRYEEDQLRKEFFRDHPWELARPRVVLENDGKDYSRFDWSQMEQSGKRLDGESVVQRQLYLLNTVPDMTKATAYDIARREFYKLRLQEDIERRIAQEEARATGAYFGPDVNTIGMEFENKSYERWKVWAEEESLLELQQNSATIAGANVEDESSGLGEEAN